MPSPKLFVLTGGPGAGKTTLLNALAHAGFAVAPEAGRAVIRAQQQSGGQALPWIDPLAFAEAMLAHDLASYAAFSAQDGPVFFDRGLPDVVGYLRLAGVAVPEAMLNAARTQRYSADVFICPPWRAIYSTDSERRQTWDVAERTHEAMVQVYTELGYALTEVPRGPVDTRVAFIRDATGH